LHLVVIREKKNWAALITPDVTKQKEKKVKKCKAKLPINK
jgi:hypothetical protein